MDLTAVDNMTAQLRLHRFSSPVALVVSMGRFVLRGVCFMLALLAPAGRPMLVTHERLLGLMSLFRASVSVSSDIGTERQRIKINKVQLSQEIPHMLLVFKSRRLAGVHLKKEKDFLDLFSERSLLPWQRL